MERPLYLRPALRHPSTQPQIDDPQQETYKLTWRTPSSAAFPRLNTKAPTAPTRSPISSTTPTKSSWASPFKDHLRFAVAYWHSLAMTGSDPFGGPTIFRPWMEPGDPIAQAKIKADAAFELFRVLDLPFFCFHDADIAPAGRFTRGDPQEPPHDGRLLRRVQDDQSYSGKAAVGNGQSYFLRHVSWPALPPIPTPTVFAWSAATVKNCMDVTKQPRRRQLRAMGRPRRLRNAAQHRHEAGTRRRWAASFRHRRRLQTQNRLRLAKSSSSPNPKEPTVASV